MPPVQQQETQQNTRNLRNVWHIASQPFPGAHFATMPPEIAERCINAGSPPRGRILDPFGGAGTTALVADRLGRDCTLIELNSAYAAMARDRIKGDAPLFAEVNA
jgi:DNA modification methylase